MLDSTAIEDARLDGLRYEAADQAFEHADFQGMSVAGTTGWEHDGVDRLHRKVFIENPGADNFAMTFSVEFSPGMVAPYPAEFELPQIEELLLS